MTANFGNTLNKSMALQEPVDFVGQFWSNAFRSRDLANACPPEPIHGPDPLQQQTFPILAHARAIGENAFLGSFFQEQLVICVSEPMRLIADALKQPQRRRIHWKL